MNMRPPRSTRTYTRWPYSTLYRSPGRRPGEGRGRWRQRPNSCGRGGGNGTPVALRGGDGQGGEGKGQPARQTPRRRKGDAAGCGRPLRPGRRSEEHTSELQSIMRYSYAVLGLQRKSKKKKTN